MFDFLDDVRDFFTPAKTPLLEPMFGGLPGATSDESLAVPGVAPDYGALASYTEEELESVDITAYESDDRLGEDFDEVYADNGVTGFDSLQEMADLVAAKANGAPLGRLEVVDHAGPGIQEVGDQDLTLASLEDEAVLATLAQLRDQFGPDGALDLKGCRVGGDAEGDALLRALANQVDVPVSGSSEYQTPFLPGLDGPVKTCHPSEFDEETQKWWQTCTTTSGAVDKGYQKIQEWIGGGIFGMEQSEME
ncbi:MAG: DUF4347 domain-containing protein [Kofleriaceae bacterium]